MKSYCHIYGQFGQTGDRLPEELGHLLDLGLACDTDVQFAQAARHRDLLRELQRRGGLVAPNIYPGDLDPACRDANWWKYPPEECVRLLGLAQARFAALEAGPMEAVNTYTPGNGFVAACRQLGVRYILGFCAPIVIEDGDWSIAHYGSPLSPYFISEEDYRKPENPAGRPDPVMMVSMELRNPLVCLRHWSEGPWCPLNAQAADRWLEPTGQPWPFLQMAEDWLRQAEETGVPKFFHINLQYFFAGRCREHNRRALEWLAEQRDKGRLEIGGIRPWAGRLRDNGGFVRQTTYWRGEMMGSQVGHRPGSVADTLVDEGLEGQAVWEAPQPLPVRWYDYRKKWNFPPFEPKGGAPASEAVDGFTVTPKGNTVSIQNAGASRRVPLAVWSVLDGLRGPFTVTADADTAVTVAPHPAGVGGAILLEREWPAGETRVELTVQSAGPAPNRHKRHWGALLEAQTFVVDHQPCTYLVAQAPARFAVTVRSAVEHVRVESLSGVEYGERWLPAGGLPLLFDTTRLAGWHRFWGVHADELEIEGVEEVEARLRRETSEVVSRLAPHLRVPDPGYQLFGNIRDENRWDRALGRAAGEAERARMNDWFRRQRPDAGEVLIEVHPGLHLPRGSITKVLGHEFDDVRCAPGFGCQELCADYPQGWDWGVAAWVQWRHLRLRIDGLREWAGPLVLHLHAFDPESRDLSQRVHFFNPAAAEVAPIPGAAQDLHTKAEWCVVTAWDLPKGLEGRWQPGALCSILIPEECRQWDALGLWICPLEKMKLHDWVAEKGAPGLISHLWLTAPRPGSGGAGRRS
jgi:hypothetical protein